MALAVIFLLYGGIGVLCAIGSVYVVRTQFTTRAEPVFFGLILAPVAAVYFAFTAYFDAGGAWGTETAAVIAFVVMGLVGIRVPLVLMLGYVLHGAWDLVHEAAALQGTAPVSLTGIPLAYGVFCAAYDWCVAGYFYTRRGEWARARETAAAGEPGGH